jgi:pimeloyl-ACP methyl ester carboxylesterase
MSRPPRPRERSPLSEYFYQDFLQRPDGARIYYQVQGEGELTVVLNDGIGCDGFAWKYLLPRLRERCRVIRWHYRGHGVSGLPRDPFNVGMAQNCDDLLTILEATGTKSAVLMGHSMGVQVALELHRMEPSKVLGMVLICGSYGRPLHTFHDSTWLATAFPYIRQVVERFPIAARRLNEVLLGTELMVELSMAIELNSQLLKRGDFVPYFDHMRRMDPVVFFRTLQSLADHTAFDHLPEVDVPVLVIGGDKDRFTPPHLSRQMAKTIPGSLLLMVPKGTHCTPLEDPELVWQHTERFLYGDLTRKRPKTKLERPLTKARTNGHAARGPQAR